MAMRRGHVGGGGRGPMLASRSPRQAATTSAEHAARSVAGPGLTKVTRPRDTCRCRLSGDNRNRDRDWRHLTGYTKHDMIPVGALVHDLELGSAITGIPARCLVRQTSVMITSMKRRELGDPWY